MTPTDVKLALQEVLGSGVYLNTAAFVVFVCGSFLAVALAAAAGAYFGKRGETAAVKRDLDTIKDNLRHTTQATEEIKAEITGSLWLKQKRLDLKWQCYSELVRGLGEVHTIISELIALEAGGPDPAVQIATKKRMLTEALEKSRQSGSIARIAVAPSVRTVLTRFERCPTSSSATSMCGSHDRPSTCCIAPGVTEIRSWGAHERVAVRRG